MEKEVTALGKLLGEPDRPFAALLGGAKIEGKIDTLENLLPRLDLLLLGGGMANTFLVSRGYDLGGSLFEPDRLDLARDILERAKSRGVEVLLPTDLVVTDDLGNPQRIETVPADRVPPGTKAVDVGRTPAPPSPRRWAAPAPCSGTVRSASSRSPRSTLAPAPWPRRWRAARASR